MSQFLRKSNGCAKRCSTCCAGKYCEAEVVLVASKADALQRQPQRAYVDVEDVEHIEQLLHLRGSIILRSVTAWAGVVQGRLLLV